MKPMKMFGLAALAALTGMAFVGTSSSMAGNTQLCNTDPNPCGSAVTHVHEVSVVNAEILNSLGRIKCAVLFLSTSVGALAAPQIIKGNFTYSSCFRKKVFGGEEACTVTEVNGHGEIKVLKTGHEIGTVAETVELKVSCGTAIECTFLWLETSGTAKGPLLAVNANGEVSIQNQAPFAVAGSFCPGTSGLDITTTPLTATYIST